MSGNVLLVKLSSMGDVVHSFPALTEAALHGHRFDWVVEEAFVDLAAMHPAVDRVLPFGLRRWRKKPLSGFRELVDFVRELRAHDYRRALDAQGLLKSALVARASGAAQRMGLDAASARESASARFYTDSCSVGWDRHAIDRLRLLFAQALGYSVNLSHPVAAPSAELMLLSSSPEAAATARHSDLRKPPAGPVLLIHGTTWVSKEYPEPAWRKLIDRLAAAGYTVSILSGSPAEYERAQRLCADPAGRPLRGVDAIAPNSLLAAAQTIRSAQLVIGVDTGLTHLAAVLGRPTIGLYGPTNAHRTGVRGPRAVDLASEFGCAPCMQRECAYTGPAELVDNEPMIPACFAQLSADRIFHESVRLLGNRSPEFPTSASAS